jgi:heptaprenyl diphosphate synthase
MIAINHVQHHQFSRIISTIRSLAQHHYVERYLPQPSIPEAKIKLLYLTMRLSGFADDEAESYCIAVGLAQMGLDVHERIEQYSPPALGEDTVSERQRQLAVLSGDYYSSRFYDFLAKKSFVHFIHYISAAIREVNEQKAVLYTEIKHPEMTAERCVDLYHRIQSRLFCLKPELKNTIAGAVGDIWEQLVGYLMHVDTLLSECESLCTEGTSILYQHCSKLNKFGEQKHFFLSFVKKHVERMIGLAKEKLEELTDRLDREAGVDLQNLILSMSGRSHQLISEG